MEEILNVSATDFSPSWQKHAKKYKHCTTLIDGYCLGYTKLNLKSQPSANFNAGLHRLGYSQIGKISV